MHPYIFDWNEHIHESSLNSRNGTDNRKWASLLLHLARKLLVEAQQHPHHLQGAAAAVILCATDASSPSRLDFLPKYPNQGQLCYAIDHVRNVVTYRLFRIEWPEWNGQNREDRTNQQVCAEGPTQQQPGP